MRNIEIFKETENGLLTMGEITLIYDKTKGVFKYNDDRANGIVAFALPEEFDENTADDLVNDLNEIVENDWNEGYWYLGDPDENYVFTD